MKYYLCLVLVIVAAVRPSAKEMDDTIPASTLVRLVKVAHSPSELHWLIATFEPIRFAQTGVGGARGPGSFPPPAVEQVAGKQFTVAFKKPTMNPHEQTLWNVIQSCPSVRGHDPDTLGLHLVLSVPTAAAKQLASDEERDFGQWIVQSVAIAR